MFAIADPPPLVRFRPRPQAQSGSRTLNGWPSGTWLPQVTSARFLKGSLRSPCGSRPVVAISRSILVIIWHLLSDPGTQFHDLGSGFYATRIDPDRRKRNHIRQLEALGYTVTLQPAA
jgi:hypothetical protein